MDYSVIIPIYNEADSLSELVQRTSQVFQQLNSRISYEIIFVDDGSSDQSQQILDELSAQYPQVKAIILRRNFGKAMALSAGFKACAGERVITMDGDLQDPPEDIPKLIDKLNEGFDVVSGWRNQRHDGNTRSSGSKFFNFVVRKLSGLKLHDFNCGFKIYNRAVIQKLNIYGDFHRYIPLLAYSHGFKVSETPVNNHKRIHGESKYRAIRFQGAFDLLTIMFVHRFGLKPLHFFAIVSLIFIIPSSIVLSYLIGNHILSWFGLGQQLEIRPLLSLALTTFMLGVNIFLTGFVCDFILHHNANSALNMVLSHEVKHILADSDSQQRMHQQLNTATIPTC